MPQISAREATRLTFCLDQIQQVSDRAMRFDRVTESDVADHTIAVSAADSFAFDKSAFFQVLNDPLNSPLCDSDLNSDFTQHGRLVLIEHDKHMRVIRQKGPPLPTSGFLHVRVTEIVQSVCQSQQIKGTNCR